GHDCGTAEPSRRGGTERRRRRRAAPRRGLSVARTVAVSTTRRSVVLGGLLLGLFTTTMEVTIVATAMPNVVGQLGGVQLYAWVFSGYLLTSTITIPVYG